MNIMENIIAVNGGRFFFCVIHNAIINRVARDIGFLFIAE